MNICYLHIGSPKTGTSAIQNFLSMNNEFLNKHGVVYPSPGLLSEDVVSGDGNAKSILKCIVNPNDILVDRLNRSLLALLENNNVIISAEDLFNRGYENGFHVLKKILKGMKVVIILYVRLQSDIFSSAIKQRIRNHNKTDYEVPLEFYKKFDWFDCAELWANEFGRDNVIVRKYKSKKSKVSIESDILNVLRIKNTPELYEGVASPINETLSGVQLEFMRLINGLDLDLDVFSQIKHSIINDFFFEITGESWSLNRSEVFKINQYFKQSNENLFKSYGVKIIPK